MIKLSMKPRNGTSFHNVTFPASVNELIQMIGQPRYCANTGDDKTNFEWVCELENGEVFTIYDWKYYRPVSRDEKIDWHIGAKSAITTLTAAQCLLELS